MVVYCARCDKPWVLYSIVGGDPTTYCRCLGTRDQAADGNRSAVAGEPLPEVECPSCGTTIRARMADGAGHVHTWVRCPECPSSEGPCACSGGICCEGDQLEFDLEVERDAARAALAELIRLKDGPRDAAYERDKPIAWTEARAVLARPTSTPVPPTACCWKLSDGRHTLNCSKRCQDCGGDVDGSNRCRCLDSSGSAGSVKEVS